MTEIMSKILSTIYLSSKIGKRKTQSNKCSILIKFHLPWGFFYGTREQFNPI